MGLRFIQQCIFIFMITQGFCSAEIRLDQSPAVVKRPGETVKISCKISGYSMTSYNMHWIRQKPGEALEWIGYMSTGNNRGTYAESVKDRVTFTEDVPASTQYLEAKSLRTEDTAVYYCARPYSGYADYFDYWGKGTSVTVTSATQEAPKSLFPVWQCGSSPDGFVTLGCVTRDLATPDGLSYVWKDASGTALTTNVVQYPAVSEGGKYSSVSQARVSANDWNANKLFTCEVTNPQGTKTAQLKKPVVPDIPAKSLLLTAPTQTELENGTAIFICLASEFSPKTSTFKWTRGETNLDNKAKDPILIAGKPTYSSFSILKLTAAEWMGSTSPVKCEFQQKSQTLSKEASYAPCDQEQPKIKIIPPSNSDILITRSGDLVCKAEGPVGFTGIKWIGKGGKEVASLPEKAVSTKAEISLTTSISYEEWSSGTKFTCEVHHSSFPQGFITEVYKRENGRSPICPGFFLLPPPESSNEDTKTLTCYIKNFYPKEVAVSWLIGDKPVNSESITNVIEKNGNFTAYSQLIVDKDAWGNGTTFTCNVYHESILEIVHHISRSLTGNSNPPSLVNLSLNVPQNCPNPGLY